MTAPVIEETEGERQDRQRRTATWKFELLETVAADPTCKPSDVSIVLAYVRYIDKPGGKSFRSNAQLQALTGLSEQAIRTRRKHLVARGYFAEAGHRPTGIPVFKIENPHINLVMDHVALLTEHLREKDAARKADERRRKDAKPQGVPLENSPPHIDVAQIFAGTAPQYLDPNTYSEYVDGFSSEERDQPKITGRYEAGDFIFDPPADQNDCDDTLTEILGGVCLPAGVHKFFAIQLMKGALRQSMVDAQLEAAA